MATAMEGSSGSQYRQQNCAAKHWSTTMERWRTTQRGRGSWQLVVGHHQAGTLQDEWPGVKGAKEMTQDEIINVGRKYEAHRIIGEEKTQSKENTEQAAGNQCNDGHDREVAKDQRQRTRDGMGPVMALVWLLVIVIKIIMLSCSTNYAQLK